MSTYKQWKRRKKKRNLTQDFLDDNFPDGTSIVVVTENDDYLWGKLKSTEDLCIVQGSGGRSYEIPWPDVTILSHDVGIVQPLKGADGSTSIGKEPTMPVARTLRQGYLTQSDKQLLESMRRFVRKHPIIKNRTIEQYKKHFSYTDLLRLAYSPMLSIPERDRAEWASNPPTMSFVAGDPFLLENVRTRIFNPGNYHPRLWYTDQTEIVLLSNGDGCALWWGMNESVHHFEKSSSPPR